MYTVKRCVRASAHLLRRFGWTLLVLMLCQAALAAEWRLSREVTITVAGDAAQVREVCGQAPVFLERIPQTNTHYSCPGSGGPYFSTNDGIYARLVGVTEPDVEATLHVRYTLTYIPTALEEPPRFVVVIVGCEPYVEVGEEPAWPIDNCCIQHPTGNGAVRAKATAFGDVSYEASANISGSSLGCLYNEQEPPKAITV